VNSSTRRRPRRAETSFQSPCAARDWPSCEVQDRSSLCPVAAQCGNQTAPGTVFDRAPRPPARDRGQFQDSGTSRSRVPRRDATYLAVADRRPVGDQRRGDAAFMDPDLVSPKGRVRALAQPGPGTERTPRPGATARSCPSPARAAWRPRRCRQEEDQRVVIAFMARSCSSTRRSRDPSVPPSPRGSPSSSPEIAAARASVRSRDRCVISPGPIVPATWAPSSAVAAVCPKLSGRRSQYPSLSAVASDARVRHPAFQVSIATLGDIVRHAWSGKCGQ